MMDAEAMLCIFITIAFSYTSALFLFEMQASILAFQDVLQSITLS